MNQNTDGTFQVKSADGARCFNMSGATSHDGANLITWTCGPEAHMKFALPGFTPQSLPYAGKVTTFVATHSNKCEEGC